ncbi:MAG: hypothetical protein JRJ14_04260 [Deltaproteobacteria bacterium]|nr:hypothetical protein [Deltaproteobacteria bacterium]
MIILSKPLTIHDALRNTDIAQTIMRGIYRMNRAIPAQNQGESGTTRTKCC